MVFIPSSVTSALHRIGELASDHQRVGKDLQAKVSYGIISELK